MADDTGAGAGRRAPVIAIVGLGPTGRALGAALQRVKKDFEILGFDRDRARGRAAKKAGDVDRTSRNLGAVAAAGDIVFLTEPVAQTLETLASVAAHVRENTLVTDTAATKVEVLRLADQVMPEGVSFVGGHPVLGLGTAIGEEPFADSFRGAPYCLVPLPRAAETAVRVLADLVSAIGAKPFFIDAQEHDALVPAVGQMPYLLSSSLMRVLDASPSIHDLQRLAGTGFDAAVSAAPSGAAEQREAVLAGPDRVVVWLDQVLADLVDLREILAGGETERLEEALRAADAARARWRAADDGEPGADGGAAFEDLTDVSPLRDMFFGRGLRRRG